jgi:L-fuconate dehydratase
MPTITRITTHDARFPLEGGAGADAIHTNPVYAYAVTRIETDRPGCVGTGLAFTLGAGNELVCRTIEALAAVLIGQDLETLMADFGRVQRSIADQQHYRWLGPHKGVVALALSSITNACWDAWAKSRGVPLWKLLLDLSPDAIVGAIDLSYVDDLLTPAEAIDLLRSHSPTRASRESVLRDGYPGYDTSVGWFNYDDATIESRTRASVDAGFTAMKLKVGSKESSRDVRRASIVRRVAGPAARVMVDANQQWTISHAVRTCHQMIDAGVDPFWVEEPTHPDDVLGHAAIARAIAPLRVAAGEHVPNRVVFKNYLQLAGAMSFCQVDAVRVGGVSEFVAVSLLARKLGVPVVPHVGDMGQLHQHLVLFNHIALGHERLFLEHIPHLRQCFVHPARIDAGVYRTPQEPGASCDLLNF